MTLLRRLSLCLLALALLPGVPAQARMAAVAGTMEAQAAHAVPAADDAQAGGCHGMKAQPSLSGIGHDGAMPDTTHPADCCGDPTGRHDCGNACACPPAITVLPPAAQSLPAAAHERRWSASSQAGRASAVDGPPKRPPIG